MLQKIIQALTNLRSKRHPRKFLSFQVLYLCIFLPPVLYIFTIQGLERYYQNSWQNQLGHTLLKNRSGLMEGTVSIQEELKDNIDNFLKTGLAATLGVQGQAVVRTHQGRLLYPDFRLDILPDLSHEPEDQFMTQVKQAMTARENRQILEEGLNFNLSAQIHHNTWLANMVLIFYILAFSLVLYKAYLYRTREAELADEKQQQELAGVRQRLEKAKKALLNSSRKELEHRKKLDDFRQRLDDADTRIRQTEEAALSELEMLEDKLSRATSQREAREIELQDLTLQLEALDKDSDSRKKKTEKAGRLYVKRFNTLYKNINIHERALEGFASLSEEWKLKAEEVVHMLDADKQNVSVKRKVFSSGKASVLETEFAHKGRIYWRQDTGNKLEIVAIGTKNTQENDMRYLHKLSQNNIPSNRYK